ncbi:hypothetical protein V1508DRAFT_406763 [Lipomyces doorenjongii]|uniref:uncharacterized protein n=1 Tax=Lipomyces doorenjongii TaxID=383834 RepID=UPI0034CE131A
MFVGNGGKSVMSCKKLWGQCRDGDFIEVVSPFLERHDKHIFNRETQSLKLRRLLLSFATCKERVNGPEFILTCHRPQERKTQRDLETTKYCCEIYLSHHGEFRIADHKCHTETQKFHVTKRYKVLSLRTQHCTRSLDSKSVTSGLHLQEKEWERDAPDDIRSAQLLLEGQDRCRWIEGLQEPGCFSDKLKYDGAKMTEVFIDSTFGTNKDGCELYCVEYDLVFLALSYLLLDTLGVREVGKRGTRLTAWLTNVTSCKARSERGSYRQGLSR